MFHLLLPRSPSRVVAVSLLCIIHLTCFSWSHQESSAKSLNSNATKRSDKEIVNDLQTGNRKLRAIGVSGDTLHLLISDHPSNSSNKDQTDPTDNYIYNMPRKNFDGTKFYLTGGVPLSTFCPACVDDFKYNSIDNRCSMFAVNDQSGFHILYSIAESHRCVTTLSIQAKGKDPFIVEAHNLLTNIKAISSSKELSFYEVSKEGSSFLAQYKFDLNHNGNVVAWETVIDPIIICYSSKDTNKVVRRPESCNNGTKHEDFVGKTVIGYIDDQYAVMFDKDGNMVTFSSSIINTNSTDKSSSVDVKKINAKDVFTDERPEDSKNVTSSSISSGTLIGITIGVIVLLALLALCCLAVYFFCYKSASEGHGHKKKHRGSKLAARNKSSTKKRSGSAIPSKRSSRIRGSKSRKRRSKLRSRKSSKKVVSGIRRPSSKRVTSTRRLSHGPSIKGISGGYCSSKRLSTRGPSSKRLSTRLRSTKRSASKLRTKHSASRRRSSRKVDLAGHPISNRYSSM